MAYQMAAKAVTLNNLEAHSSVAGLYNIAIRRSFVQHFTRFRLCSHGSSALAELRVPPWPSILAQVHLLEFDHSVFGSLWR